QRHGRRGIAVIDLVHTARAHRQRRRCDGGGGRGGRIEAVVARVRAGDRNAAHRDRLAGAHVLVGERRARVAGGDDIAAHVVVRQRHGRRGIAVIDLVHTARAHRQRRRCDGGGGRGGRIEAVVARVRAGDRNAAHRDRLAGAHVLVGERRARVAGGDDIAAHVVVRQRHGRRGIAVI